MAGRLEGLIVKVRGVTSLSLESVMLGTDQPAPDSPVPRAPAMPPQRMRHYSTDCLLLASWVAAPLRLNFFISKGH